MPFRILSIDGGGLRGIIPIQLLKEVELRTGKKILESFDLIAGTSTGGIITAALNVPDKPGSLLPKYSLSDIEWLYRDYGKRIFPIPSNRFGKWIREQRNIFRPKYKVKGIDEVLMTYLGDTRFIDLILPTVITSYDIGSFSPLLFSRRYVNKTSRGYAENRNVLVRDICRATSAAPTYFPSHSFEFENDEKIDYSPNCIDGGVFMNNPTLAAIAELLKHTGDPVYNKYTGDVREIFILSLGTGHTSKSISPEKCAKWGQFKWAKPLIDLMMQANSQAVDYQVEQVFENNYLRVDVDLEAKYAEMDDASPATYNYLVKRISSGVLNNPEKLGKLERFIRVAGL